MTTPDYTHLERIFAAEIFHLENKKRGALTPAGFGFLRSTEQKPFLERARTAVSKALETS